MTGEIARAVSGLLRTALALLEREAGRADDLVSRSETISSSAGTISPVRGITSADEEPPGARRRGSAARARVGRMVELRSATVLVVPLVPIAVDPTTKVGDEEPPTFRELPPVELSRVPTAHEYIAIGGETLRVLSVRHVVGDVAAELHCERLPALQAKGETGDTLSPVSEREAAT